MPRAPLALSMVMTPPAKAGCLPGQRHEHLDRGCLKAPSDRLSEVQDVQHPGRSHRQVE